LEESVWNCERIEQEAERIDVQTLENQDVSVENNSSLSMMGKGRQGAVFKINDQWCMKVYGEEEDCEREYFALSLGKDTPLIPNVYCKGENFIVMDMVYGIDLREYLQTNPLTKNLSYQLIQLLIVFKQIGYERIDHHKRQIFLQPDGTLKVIDVGRTVWRNRTYPYPRKLLQSLGEDYKAVFMSHVQEMAPDLHDEWEHYIEMEAVSRKLYHQLEHKGTNLPLDSVNEQAMQLLTTKDRKAYYKQLKNLIGKIVEEEREREKEKKKKRKEKKESDKMGEAG
jgi:RIO-like serine/threonine protein kinase